ncbi:MAG TPA: hypothetical protein VG817_06920 [Gemmatimonadales bacterium]|nr:hypothetical protein [Gemmatimonadales bacterium]
MITLLIFVAAVAAGFTIASSFVRRRLRFVDAIYSPAAPWLAGLAAAVIAWPLAILPLVSTLATTLFGVGAGLGTASGGKALRRGQG